MIKQKLFLKGKLKAILEHANGEKEIFAKDNLIVDGGVDFIADAIGKAAGRPDVMSHIAVGESDTVVGGVQTALLDEIERKAATYAHVAGETSFTFSATFNAGEGTGAIAEAGVLNADENGILLDRVVFDLPIPKGADDVLTLIFTFTISQD